MVLRIHAARAVAPAASWRTLVCAWRASTSKKAAGLRVAGRAQAALEALVERRCAAEGRASAASSAVVAADGRLSAAALRKAAADAALRVRPWPGYRGRVCVGP